MLQAYEKLQLVETVAGQIWEAVRRGLNCKITKKHKTCYWQTTNTSSKIAPKILKQETEWDQRRIKQRLQQEKSKTFRGKNAWIPD